MFNRLIPITALALVMSACGSGAKTPGTTPPTPGQSGLKLTLSPTSATVNAGGPKSTEIALNITRDSRATGNVDCELSAADGSLTPSGIIIEWLPGYPGYSYIFPDKVNTAAMTLEAYSGTPNIGDVALRVRCDANGQRSDAFFTLTVK
jgi:hypothetical protein